MTDMTLSARTGAAGAAWLRPVLEWAFWMALAAVAFDQTALFDREIPNYAFGATGWPRAICAAIALGATGQLLHRLTVGRRAETAARAPAGGDLAARLKRAPIFLFPLLFLWLAPRLGFYLTAPVFILGMLLILQVRSVVTLVTATAAIYALVLLVFTRLFFVALPVGRIESLYEINTIIVGLARWGM